VFRLTQRVRARVNVPHPGHHIQHCCQVEWKLYRDDPLQLLNAMVYDHSKRRRAPQYKKPIY